MLGEPQDVLRGLGVEPDAVGPEAVADGEALGPLGDAPQAGERPRIGVEAGLPRRRRDIARHPLARLLHAPRPDGLVDVSGALDHRLRSRRDGILYEVCRIDRVLPRSIEVE